VAEVSSATGERLDRLQRAHQLLSRLAELAPGAIHELRIDGGGAVALALAMVAIAAIYQKRSAWLQSPYQVRCWQGKR